MPSQGCQEGCQMSDLALLNTKDGQGCHSATVPNMRAGDGAGGGCRCYVNGLSRGRTGRRRVVSAPNRANRLKRRGVGW